MGSSSDEQERQRNALLVTKHLAEYERLQTMYKEAIVEQHRRTMQELAEERRELLGPNGAGKLLLQTESDALAASRNITDGLRRTKQVLAEVGSPLPLFALVPSRCLVYTPRVSFSTK